jgi:hypothetical protein
MPFITLLLTEMRKMQFRSAKERERERERAREREVTNFHQIRIVQICDMY